MIWPPAIETENLTKDFLVGFWRPRPYRALDGLTLSVEPGEVFGFLGPNGAGKSTTLKLLMQLIYPTRRPGAHSRAARRATSAVRQRIGFLAENPYYYDYLTAEEVLDVFCAAVRLFAARDVTDARGARPRRSRASAPSGGCGCGSSRRACCSASASRRRSSTIPKWCFSTSRCPASIRSAAAQVRDLILGLRAQGLHRVLQLAHPVGRRNAVQPRRRSWRRAGWSRPAASARWWRSSSRAGSWWSSGVTRRRCRRALAPRVRAIRPLSHGRFTLDLPPDAEARAADDRAARRAAPASCRCNPVRETLEDYFVQQVRAAKPRDTAGSDDARHLRWSPARCSANRFAIACRTAWWCSRCC